MFAGASEESHVGPGIEFVLEGQYADLRRQAAVAQLGEIRVSLPVNAAKEVPIAQPKREEIAATAMIRSENKLFRFQLSKSIFHINGAKTGAVATDDDDLVVAELVDFLDRIPQPRRKAMPDLRVNARSVRRRAAAGSKKMDVNLRRKLRAERGEMQKRPGRIWEGAAGQIDLCFLGKN